VLPGSADRELGYSGSDQKMTFATLPPEFRSLLLENARNAALAFLARH
jgi:hypothetical protein